MEKYALWARQHSPLLLQVTTTNPLESYYSEFKKTTSKQHKFI
ncbi:1040_t:CDS:1, partial [Dentiscutata heterogama]